MTVLHPSIGPDELGLPLAPDPVVRHGLSVRFWIFHHRRPRQPQPLRSPRSAGFQPGRQWQGPARFPVSHARFPELRPPDSVACLARAAPPAERRPPLGPRSPHMPARRYPEKLEEPAAGERLRGVVRTARLAGLARVPEWSRRFRQAASRQLGKPTGYRERRRQTVCVQCSLSRNHEVTKHYVQ